MKNLCRNYLNGSCRYGDRCRFIHPKITSLLDPPSWIYTNVYNQTNLNCLEISTDEVRYSLLVNDTRKILDDIWFDNYSKMYKSLNEICRVGIGRSTSNRVVDLRIKPEVFNLPFDLGRVEEKIVELRKKYPVVGENDVMKGEEEGEKGEVKEREVEEMEMKEGVPKFIKEYQEKKISNRDSSSNKEYRDSNRDRDNSSNRPFSFRQPDNRYQPRDQQYRDGSNRSFRDQPYRDNREQYPKGQYNRDQPYRDNRDQPFRDGNRDQYNRNNPPFRQDSYNKPSSYPRSQPPTQSSYPRSPQRPPYSPSPQPSQRPSYSPTPQPKKEEDSDFEYKNIPYNFDRK